jgi:hypothetical protein
MITHQLRAVPRDGLRHPVFVDMGSEEDLIVSLSFLPGLTNAQMAVVHRWLKGLDSESKLGDMKVSPLAAGEPFVHEHLFHARIGNLRDPRWAVDSLISSLTEAGGQIRDCFFACWERRPDGIMGPRRDPGAPEPFGNITCMREYLDRLWDFAATPPPSEVETDLKGGFMSMDQLILEHRGSPLYFPEVRVGYGVVPADRQAADRRTSEVRRSVVESLTWGWKTVFKAPGRAEARPQPVNRSGDVDQIDRIRCGTRIGYRFSIQCVQLLDRPSPSSCRYREYELMEAMIDTVARLELAPIVTWQRFGTPTALKPIAQPETVEVQLWESGGDHTDHRGLDQPWPIRRPARAG